jgi:hypothetical protein
MAVKLVQCPTSKVQRLSKQTLVGGGGLIGKQTLDFGHWTLKEHEQVPAIRAGIILTVGARSKQTNAPRRLARFD